MASTRKVSGLVFRLLSCLMPPALAAILSAAFMPSASWGQAATPVISAGGIVDNASYGLVSPNLSPGTIAAIFGTGLTDGSSCVPSNGCFPTFDSQGRLGTTMSGTQVLVNGVPAPIFYATPNQLGIQIPPDLPGTSASVRVTVKGSTSNPFTLHLAPFSPGIFTVSQDGRGAGAVAHPDGSLVTVSNPARPGEIVILYATGLGQATPALGAGRLPSEATTTLTNPSVTVDGLPALIQFSGLSGCCVGLNQINVMIPVTVRSGNELPLILNIGGSDSNPVTIAVSENPLVSSPAFVDFGDVPVEARSTASVTITNRGDAGLSITHTEMLPIEEGSVVSGFSVSGLSLPHRLERGQSVTFSVNFDPAAPGNFAARLSIYSDAIVGMVVPLVANATFHPSIATNSLLSATQGAPYSATLTAAGGQPPYSWSISEGNLPAGLALDTISGEIFGTPTGTGTSTFTARVIDGNSRVDIAPLSITVVPAALGPELSIVTTALQTGRQNSSYAETLVAAGGKQPYSWSVNSNLPAGLSLSPSGLISGTPTSSGVTQVSVRVTDADSRSATAQWSLSIVEVLPLAILTSSLPAGTQGVAYNANLRATGGRSPYSWTITTGSLPAGLTLASSTGAISGTPTGTGTSTFTVQVADADFQTKAVTINFVVVQAAPPPVITTSSLAVAFRNVLFQASLTVENGLPPYTWSVSEGSLPPGLTLISSSGIITGSPTSAGTSTFSIRVADANSQADAAPFALTVDSRPPVPISLSWTASTAGVTGYNVYRGNVSGGPYFKVNSALVTGAQFDDLVPPGGTYVYVVTAESASGLESGFSDESAVTVP